MLHGPDSGHLILKAYRAAGTYTVVQFREPQLEMWHYFRITVDDMDGELEFIYKRNYGNYGDAAVDDISVTDTACEELGITQLINHLYSNSK